MKWSCAVPQAAARRRPVPVDNTTVTSTSQRTANMKSARFSLLRRHVSIHGFAGCAADLRWWSLCCSNSRLPWCRATALLYYYMFGYFSSTPSWRDSASDRGDRPANRSAPFQRHLYVWSWGSFSPACCSLGRKTDITFVLDRTVLSAKRNANALFFLVLYCFNWQTRLCAMSLRRGLAPVAPPPAPKRRRRIGADGDAL